MFRILGPMVTQCSPISVLFGYISHFEFYAHSTTFTVTGRRTLTGHYRKATEQIDWDHDTSIAAAWTRPPSTAPTPLHSKGQDPNRVRQRRRYQTHSQPRSHLQVEKPWLLVDDPYFPFEHSSLVTLQEAVRLAQRFYGATACWEVFRNVRPGSGNPLEAHVGHAERRIVSSSPSYKHEELSRRDSAQQTCGLHSPTGTSSREPPPFLPTRLKNL